MIIHNGTGHIILRFHQIRLSFELISNIRIVVLEQQRHHLHLLPGQFQRSFLNEIIFPLLLQGPNAFADIFPQGIQFGGKFAHLFFKVNQARAIGVALGELIQWQLQLKA